MNAVDELLDRALRLSLEERADLAHRLLLTLKTDEEPLSDEEREAGWRAELQRRLDAAERGDFAEGDWRDVIARARQFLTDGTQP